MVEQPVRPERGLDIHDAMGRWGNPKTVSIMLRYRDARHTCGEKDRMHMHLHYLKSYKSLAQLLRRLLCEAKVAASCPARSNAWGVTRQVLHPTQFLDLRGSDLVAPDSPKMRGLEFFHPTAIPRNVWTIPSWYNEEFGLPVKIIQPAEPPAGADFRPSRNYRHVEIGRVSFDLSVTQARVIRHLHEASAGSDPWVSSRVLLAAANTEADKLAQVFRTHKVPHWSLLIESDKKGSYRLNVG